VLNFHNFVCANILATNKLGMPDCDEGNILQNIKGGKYYENKNEIWRIYYPTTIDYTF
jgi:hypothetical protein